MFDGYKYIGTMQICVARMLKESGIFFALLSVLAIGFTQGLFALDAADGTAESASSVSYKSLERDWMLIDHHPNLTGRECAYTSVAPVSDSLILVSGPY